MRLIRALANSVRLRIARWTLQASARIATFAAKWLKI